MRTITALLLLATLTGCRGEQAPAAQAPAGKAPAPEATQVQAPQAPPAPAAVAATDGVAPESAMSQGQSQLPAPPVAASVAAPPPKGPNDIVWPTEVAWKTYDEGIAQAKAEGKGVALLIYADWCPKCRSLAPAFTDPEVLELSRNVVMIKQDQDDKPAFIAERFADIGNYVPRLLFLSPDGTLRPDLTSGHPRFPYFYMATNLEALKASLRSASKS